ncbi:hypothetical protein SAMN04488038_105223 [Solimonas aquatica]|uniref:Uncharacterized protein n=1 Tax=Solimonas aquatica TaxID=489703 RepID=A0A1H9F2P9_9GAMM|nr:hypothetical protein [Solimonas aquatica]SEQ31713.1 hypothetical protein SAMN04488038_105223 [Solimonas aquatica]
MYKALAIGLAFFAVFAVAGYSVGRSVVTAEPYMMSTIANASTVRLTGQRLVLDVSDPGKPPYWSLDLADNRPAFRSAEAMLRSLDGKTVSAQSNLLMLFASGGAASTTVGTVYKQVLEARKTGDWLSFVAMVVGGASGYLAGYSVALKTAKPSDKEIQLALRNPRTVEKVKKYVFLSLLKKQPPQTAAAPADSAYFDQACAAIREHAAHIDCLSQAWAASGYTRRPAYAAALIQGAGSALSSDEVNLKGEAFWVFVLATAQGE